MTYPCTAGCNPPPCPSGYTDSYGSIGCDGSEACEPGDPLVLAPCSTCCRVCLAPVNSEGVPTAEPIWLNCASPGATVTAQSSSDDLLLLGIGGLLVAGVVAFSKRRR